MTKETTVKFSQGEIEKRIWGHRLYNEQTGMMTLLEFLCVLERHPFHEQLANPNISDIKLKHKQLAPYSVAKRPLLRSLLFNNPYIDEIYDNNIADPWEKWCEHFIADEQNKKIDAGSLNHLKDHLDELKAHFNEKGYLSDRASFECFAKIIRLIRYSGINLQSGKRWTSRFAFPWGKHCLYLEIDEKTGSIDRRFFARNGELLYMMLCFAEKRGELAEILNRKIFECENDLDTICQILSMGKDNYHTVSNPTGDGCVLPIDFFNEATRARINILCNDLITLFKLPIPTPDIIKHVARLLSLNLLCYFLEQSREAIKAFSTDSRVLPCIMPCEILTKESTDVRRISRAFFEKHRQMSLDAVRLYYEHYVGKEPIDSLNEDDDQKSASKKSSGATLEDILKNHRRHWGANLHRFLGKDCGLATNINAKSFRYAPSDSLIETLAAVIVPVGRKRLLLSDFLELAYKRYNLVFGEKEFSAAGIVDKSLVPDSSELDANRFRLQAKLSSLGLLVALSDGFEFVLNPYHA